MNALERGMKMTPLLKKMDKCPNCGHNHLYQGSNDCIVCEECGCLIQTSTRKCRCKSDETIEITTYDQFRIKSNKLYCFSCKSIEIL